MNAKVLATNKLWRAPGVSGLELLHAHHLKQSFSKHTHEGYAVGVIEGGALGFFYRGENVVAAPGQINLCVPGEVHTGRPATPEGWSYRMFYFDARLLQQVAGDLADRPRALPFFQSGVIVDARLAQRLRQVHQRLENPHTPPLEQQTLLLDVLTRLILRHADTPLAFYKLGREPEAVRLVKSYLESCPAEAISLEQLACLTNLSRYHLVRVFHRAVGVPPHAYHRQVRIGRAKELLASGHPIAEVALATGFTDQSHLNRWFKRLWGFTPGEYRNSVQYRSA